MSLLLPDENYNSFFDIDFNRLKQAGYKYLILDIDDTLIPRKTKELPAKLKSLLDSLKPNFKMVLLSNSIQFARIKMLGDQLGIPSRGLVGKPFPFAYNWALKQMEGKAQETVVIGDQLFMDIWGGKWARMHTIMVKNILPETFWSRKLMRAIEKFLMRS